jgi:CRISPR/Cas system-associated exonuclease Cas4 (RecB family)
MTQNLAPQHKHHPLSPSKWPAIAECADFENEEDIDDVETANMEEETGAEADDAKVLGQILHKALAKALTRQPDPFSGLTPRQEDEVRWTAETVISICEEYGYSADDIQVEQRVAFVGPDFKEVYFGTGDVFCGPLVFDYKSGDERNYVVQLMGYALPRMEAIEYPRMYGFLLYGRFRRVRRYTLDRATVETVAYGILNKRQNPNRRPTVCSYCGFCMKAKNASCSALNGVVETIAAKRDDWMIKLPHASIRQAAGDPVIAGALRFIAKRYAEKWIDGVEYLTKGMAENGMKPLGWRIQRDKKGRASFKSGKAVVDALAKAGVQPEFISEAATFAMGKLTTAWISQYGGTEEAAEAKLTEILTVAGAMTRGEPTMKLVAEKGAEEMIAAALARNVTPSTNLLP